MFLREIEMDIVRNKEALEKKINELGYDLVSINRKIEKGDVIISIVVDRIEPIDMDSIVYLSGELSTFIDSIDDSNEKYFLDISSLGAELPLSSVSDVFSTSEEASSSFLSDF